MLATYLVPLGSNEATITFTGSQLTTADFDDLVGYVEMFKKQYERKMASQKICGTIQTEPRTTGGNRITFLLAVGDGQVISCVSGAGTKFEKSQFVVGNKVALFGGPVAELIGGGETAYFVFYIAE